MSPAANLPVFATALLMTGWALVPRAAPSPWLINETPSLPRGLYQRIDTAPRVGTLVTLAPPASAAPYLRRIGAPAGARLLKRIEAGPGELVCARQRRLSWPRGAVNALGADRQGRPLNAWEGCRRLGPGEFLVLGQSPASFDSRYFGPVGSARVEGVYREVWRW